MSLKEITLCKIHFREEQLIQELNKLFCDYQAMHHVVIKFIGSLKSPRSLSIYKSLHIINLMDPSISKTIEQFNKKVVEVTNPNIKYKPVKADDELTRLLNDKFYNPYDVLQLYGEATEDQIKKQFRNLAVLIHPDKNDDPRVKSAWPLVQQAHKTLLDPAKRQVYLRIMKQAKDRTLFQRERQNKKREKNGQPALPEDTYQAQYQQMCHKIFQDIEQRKNHLVNLQQSTHSRKMHLFQTKKMVQQYKILTEDEWQRTRQKRVSNWRNFSKDNKFVIGSKKSDKAIRPPPVRPETRPDYVPVDSKKSNI